MKSSKQSHSAIWNNITTLFQVCLSFTVYGKREFYNPIIKGRFFGHIRVLLVLIKYKISCDRSWFLCRLAVYISLLVTLRKGSLRASCKPLRWDKVNMIRKVCIGQYRIVFSFHLAKWINHPDPSWDRKVGYCSRWPLSLWPREQALRSQAN